MSSSVPEIHDEQQYPILFGYLFEPPIPPRLSTLSLSLPTRMQHDLERTPSPTLLTLADRSHITERLLSLPPEYCQRVTDACYSHQGYASWNQQLLQAEDESWRFSLSEMDLQWVERVEILSEYVGVVEGLMRAKWRRMALRIEDMQAQIPETPPWRNLRIAATCVCHFHGAFYRPHEQERVFNNYRLVLGRGMTAVAETSDIWELWRQLYGSLIVSECLKRNYWMFTGAFDDMDYWHRSLRPPHRPKNERPDDPRWNGRFNERVMIWMNILSHLPSLEGDLPPMYEWVSELTAQVNSQAERTSLGYP